MNFYIYNNDLINLVFIKNILQGLYTDFFCCPKYIEFQDNKYSF